MKYAAFISLFKLLLIIPNLIYADSSITNIPVKHEKLDAKHLKTSDGIIYIAFNDNKKIGECKLYKTSIGRPNIEFCSEIANLEKEMGKVFALRALPNSDNRRDLLIAGQNGLGRLTFIGESYQFKILETFNKNLSSLSQVTQDTLNYYFMGSTANTYIKFTLPKNNIQEVSYKINQVSQLADILHVSPDLRYEGRIMLLAKGSSHDKRGIYTCLNTNNDDKQCLSLTPKDWLPLKLADTLVSNDRYTFMITENDYVYQYQNLYNQNIPTYRGYHLGLDSGLRDIKAYNFVTNGILQYSAFFTASTRNKTGQVCNLLTIDERVPVCFNVGDILINPAIIEVSYFK